MVRPHWSTNWLIAIAGAVLAAMVMAPTSILAAARTCAPNEVAVSAGKRWDPSFRGPFKCTPRALNDCGNGMSCPRGSRCLYNSAGGPAGCSGKGDGPLCSNGKRCPSGYLCMPPPGRSCYDPAISYPCGVASCSKTGRYLPGDRCYPCYVRRGGR